MTYEVLGIDHIYITVSDLERAEVFYDGVMQLLGFHKGTNPVGGQPHFHYYNRVTQYTIRPAPSKSITHNPLVPGLHHVRLQVADKNTVDRIAQDLRRLGIQVSEPRLYPDYGMDYYAIYFKDPDGIELEIVNRTQRRNLICDHWDELVHFENPLSKAGLI
ncbi:MAG: VOC family protein [Chloroflexi bacterium]|nr:VOC family protein [Chloroflexota bacterium]